MILFFCFQPIDQPPNESIFEGYYSNVPPTAENNIAVPISIADVSSSSNLSINVAVQSSHHDTESTMALNLQHNNHPAANGNFALGIFEDGSVKEEYPLFHEYRYQPAPINCHYQQ